MVPLLLVPRLPSSVAAVVADLEAAFSTTGLEGDVLAFVAMAGQQRWLAWE